jgi:hypothetical protein
MTRGGTGPFVAFAGRTVTGAGAWGCAMADERKVCKVEGVQVYTREAKEGGFPTLDATAGLEQRRAIERIADDLQGRGYGVMRTTRHRAGRVHYRFEALWAGPGGPPERPLDGAS